MKKQLFVSIIFSFFILISACINESLTPTPPTDPRVIPLLNRITTLAAEMESLEQTVTAIGFTPTPSETPTKVPDATEFENLLRNTIEGEVIGVLGAKISVMNASYSPGGTELYVEMSCVSGNNSICPSSRVIAAVIDTCKEKKKKVLENIHSSTQLLSITIYDPGHATLIVEVDWPDVLLYLNGDIPPEDFIKLLRYASY